MRPPQLALSVLQRVGYFVSAVLLAMLIAWVGLAYQGRSSNAAATGTGDHHTGMQLRQVRTLLLDDAAEHTTSAWFDNLLARADWTAQGLPLSFGWTDKVLWTRLVIDNSRGAARDVWLEVAPPRLTFLRLHQPTSGGVWQSQTSGVSVAAAERPVEAPELVFPLRLQAGEQREVLLEVRSSSTAMNLTFMLHNPNRFMGASGRTHLLDLLLIGGTLTLGVLSLGIGLVQGQGVQLMLGLRSLMIGFWLLLQLGFLALVLPSGMVAWLAGLTVWMAHITLMLTTAFIWLFLLRASPQGLPRAVQVGFSVLLALPLMYELLAWLGLRDPRWVGPFLAVSAACLLLYSLCVSAVLLWKGSLSAATILVTSLGALLLNSPYYLAIWGISRTELVRQFISPIPVLITSAVFFMGATLQLARERRASQALRAHEQGQALARLEGMVSERTLSLQAARDDAQRANAAKSVFMAKVSHELRTPLHTVLGYLNLALRDQPPPTVARKLEVSRRAGEQLAVHIDGLLDFARMEHEQLALVHAPLILADLLSRVSERTRLLTEEHSNHFVSEFVKPCHVPASAVVGDALRLEQVLMILISNAMRYTHNGLVTLQVSVAPAVDSVQLRFAVTDTGRGISSEALARIFMLFERGDSADRGGLGLGLPIAQQLLALMDSRLDVSSQPGAGSVFAFALCLPLADPLTTTDVLWPGMVPASAMSQAQAYDGAVRHVLVLDDLPEGRQYLQELLQGLGFEVTAVATVAQAVAASQHRGAWDLCIVDQQLAEGATGWAFVAWLQTAAVQPATLQACPVLMLSAAGAQPPTGLALARGVDRHLIKPASEAVLLDALAALMGLQWRERTAQAAEVVEATKLVASDAVHAAVPPARWRALQACAEQGDITGWHQWLQTQPNLVLAHPLLDGLFQRLDFVGMARYAQAQASVCGVDIEVDVEADGKVDGDTADITGAMPAQLR